MNRAPEPFGESERVKCLIVDDLDENLMALAAVLSGQGVELLQARSGREALELLLVHDVALALLDVQMPEMDGFELAELIRGSERTRHVPIVFVTAGNRDRLGMFEGYESGAVDFIYKPLEPQVLRSKAGVFFELYRQRRRLDRELRERTEALRFNELFVAMLGHDLRNPLSAMLASAELLKRRSADLQVQQTATRLLASGKRMSRMIEDVLDVARARLGGGIALRRSDTDLGELIDIVVQEYCTAFPGRVIAVERCGELGGQWDPERLSQVAANLIGNAVQHGGPGPISIELDGTQAETVLLRVANAGTIPAEVLPHIFDPFRGGERQGRRSDGLGLGLFIVQQIVQAHVGTIAVNALDVVSHHRLQAGRDDRRATGDEPGAGRTVFNVRLPRARGPSWETPADRIDPLR